MNTKYDWVKIVLWGAGIIFLCGMTYSLIGAHTTALAIQDGKITKHEDRLDCLEKLARDYQKDIDYMTAGLNRIENSIEKINNKLP